MRGAAALVGARHRPRALAAGSLCVLALGGCPSQSGSPAAARPAQRTAIERYVGEVEPIRLAVNKLLGGADRILDAFHDRRIAPRQAARRMGRLEQRFASYTVDIAAVDPPTAQLRALNAGYANTYVFEDAYLSALVAGLADGELADLPNTQAAQRAAIIRWRIGLTVLARAANAPLPADLQQAGRGEIAPSLDGLRRSPASCSSAYVSATSRSPGRSPLMESTSSASRD
jgi:hypothetical protein